MFLLIQVDKCEASKNSEQQDLQDLPLGKGVDEVVRDDVQQEVHDTKFFPSAGVLADDFGIKSVRINVHASAWLEDGGDNKPNAERKRRDDLKIEQCFEADTPQFASVSDIRDSYDDAEKDDRRDHHADELNKSVAKRLHRLRKYRKEKSYKYPRDNAGEHTRV
jgi:hypothetical protein